MMEYITWTVFLLGCFLVLAQAVETLLGFGSTLIALALGVQLPSHWVAPRLEKPNQAKGRNNF
jgi:hypothetical protein